MDNTTVAALRGQIEKARESNASLQDFVEKFVTASGLHANATVNFPLLFGGQEKTLVFIDGLILNQEQLRIFNMIMKNLRNNQGDSLQLFVSGAAGTGKTKLLKAIRDEVRLVFGDDSCIATTFTFTGAKAIDGATINSTFMIPVKSNGPSSWQLSPYKKTSLENKLKKAKVLLMDCINFVESHYVQAVDQKLRAIMNPQKPFGGLPVVLFGDMFQMPPIKGNSIWNDPQSKTLWNQMKIEELTKNERVTDFDDLELFNVLRSGNAILTQAVVDHLKKICVMKGETELDVVQELRNLRNQHRDKTFAVLSNSNANVDKILETFSHTLGPKISIRAKDPVKNAQFPTPQYTSIGKYEKKDLEVHIGSQVMLASDFQPFSYGTIGTVTRITEDIIYVDFHNVPVEVTRCGWYHGVNGWKQFPLSLAEAFTYSSCQETNVDGIIVFGEIEEKSLYTVLSRARSLKLCRFTNVSVLDNLSKRDLEKEKMEMNRLKSGFN